MKVKIPYSKTFLEIEVPDKNLKGILKPSTEKIDTDSPQDEIVNKSLNNPIGSPLLENLSHGKDSVTIITSDHTRPVPSKITMPLLLERIRQGNPDAEITILVATGFHRATTNQELTDKFGENIVNNERFIIHDSQDMSELVFAGTLPSGGELWLNRYAVETDLLISEGFIEPHFFAGFSGGRKSVLPGVAGYKTVLANHCAEFISSENARTGILKDNPIHTDMCFAAKQAKLTFILNVVLDENKRIINAFAGDSEKAHIKGCRFVSDLMEVDKIPADIVVTSNSGYPLDQNIYQAVKGMTAAEACCKENGIIIMISACNDGHGGQSFYDHLANAESPQQLLEQIKKIPQDKTLPDQWEFQILARILSRFKVILVTDMCDPDMIKSMHMLHTSTFKDALNKALEIKGSESQITVIPDGVSIVLKQ